ncbi:hypothetical protein ACFQ20_05230, partial [Pseudoroseomonas ludipueritiae]
RAEEPRRRPPAPVPAPRAETVALREAPREVVREAPPRERVVAESPRPGLLRQAIHLPISSANASTLPQPGTGGSVGAPVAAGGSSLGMASRGTLAPPVPLPVPVR